MPQSRSPSPLTMVDIRTRNLCADFAGWLSKRARDADERFVREVDVEHLSLRERVDLLHALAANHFEASLVRYTNGALATVFWVERSITSETAKKKK